MVVEGQLFKYNESDTPINFVSVAVFVEDNNEVSHAAILIRYLAEDYLFHYPGGTPPIIEDLQTNPTTKVVVYKILDNFDITDSGDIGAFLQHCKRVCIQTDVSYGFMFDGSTYDSNGRYQSLSGLPEIATCVGFCTNILTNAIIDVEDSYFDLDDWDDNGIPRGLGLWAEQELVKNYPSLDWTLFNSYKKRISPLEYLGSAFCKEYPITKAHLAPIIPEVELELEKIL